MISLDGLGESVTLKGQLSLLMTYLLSEVWKEGGFGLTLDCPSGEEDQEQFSQRGGQPKTNEREAGQNLRSGN